MGKANSDVCTYFIKAALRISRLTSRCNFTKELRVKLGTFVTLTEAAVPLEHAATTYFY
jgi:hypothetical protein